jgi:signal transduction histidine kinase
MDIQRRRKLNMLLQPGLQLKLPLILLSVTVVFAVFQMGHAYYAYNQIFGSVLKEAGQPKFLEDLIHDQTRDFIKVSTEIALAYILLIVALSVGYAHKMIGPTIAFRRHIEAMKNGDYSSRIHLRKGDAFVEMQDDLNELASLLERDDKKREGTDSPPEAV